MAIISNNNRYEGSTSRMIGFGGDKLILDNRAMDSDMIQINNNTVDIPGHAQELIAGDWQCLNNAMEPKKYVSNNYPIKPTCIDISQDNPVFGTVTWSDPAVPNENYVRSNVYSLMSNETVNKLHKLDDKGNILLTFQRNGMYGEVIDADSERLYTLEYDDDHNNYLFKINRKTLVSEGAVSWGNQYFHNIQVLARTHENIIMFSPGNGKPMRHDKTLLTGATPTALLKKVATVKDLTVSTYSNSVTNNFTPAMKNKFHYRVQGTDFNTALAFEALYVDPNSLTYDTRDKTAIKVNWSGNCEEDLKKLTVFGSPNQLTRFNTYKLSDTIFVMFKVEDFYNRTSLGTVKKSAYYVCQVDESDPTVVNVLQAKTMDYVYLGNIIRYDNDKFILLQESVAAHMYKFNYNTNDFALTWNITTPNLVSCCYYNNVFWWLNGSTKELNYETETNTLTIQDRFDHTEITLPDADSTGSTNYYISIYNAEGKRVEKNVKLECQGPGTFNNDLKEMTTTTSLDDDLNIPIKITTAGQFFIKVTILS